LVAKCAGNDAGIPTIQLDLGAVKGGIVGESEQNIRTAFKVIQAVSNGRVLILATCNSVTNLSTELLRRFKSGKFYFDLPTRQDKDLIWKLKMRQHKLDITQELPDDSDWTGSEIENACDLARRQRIPVIEAALNVVPVARADAAMVEALRKQCTGVYTSATYTGVYRGVEANDPVVAGKGRKFN
jgi:SpoVK/Ycf46/Vps4 family AAA+-type ATPase